MNSAVEKQQDFILCLECTMDSDQDCLPPRSLCLSPLPSVPMSLPPCLLFLHTCEVGFHSVAQPALASQPAPGITGLHQQTLQVSFLKSS